MIILKSLTNLIDKSNLNDFKLNKKLVTRYFSTLKGENDPKIVDFERYFDKFYKFCFELPLQNMIREALNFKG